MSFLFGYTIYEYQQSSAFNLLTLYYNVKSNTHSLIMHMRQRWLEVKFRAQKNITTWLSDLVRLGPAQSGPVRSGPVQVLKKAYK